MLLAAVRSFFPIPIATREKPAAARTYELVELGTLPNHTPLLPVALNERGEICLEAHPRGGEGLVQSFLLREGKRVPAGIAFGQAPARCVSTNGLLAGATGSALRSTRAWASHLGTFGDELWPDAMSFARGINAAGDVVGNVLFDAGEFMLSRAFLRMATGHARFLMPPHGGTTSAVAINDEGAVAFNATPLGAALDDSRAWCLRDGCYYAIAGLGGRKSCAQGITPNGLVYGHALTSRGETHAFLWNDGRITDLGTMEGGASEAFGANDERTVVGRVTSRDGERRAFRWTPTGGMTWLHDNTRLPRGWTLTDAIGINARGEIIGIGRKRGSVRGFLLRPV